MQQDYAIQGASAADRPSGTIRVQVQQLSGAVSTLEDISRRIDKLLNRLVDPRPEPGGNPENKAALLETANPSIESELSRLIRRAEKLCGALTNAADRLDSSL